METIRVVIAEDHPATRQYLSGLLQRQPDVEVVGSAQDGMEALQLATRLEPEVLVLDIQMPRLSGVEVLRRLRQRRSPVRVLVVSAHWDHHFLHRLLEIGADKCLSKSEVPDALVRTVRELGRLGW
jgi:DNA-binding NarL/FixJ family response regulator